MEAAMAELWQHFSDRISPLTFFNMTPNPHQLNGFSVTKASILEMQCQVPLPFWFFAGSKNWRKTTSCRGKSEITGTYSETLKKEGKKLF